MSGVLRRPQVFFCLGALNGIAGLFYIVAGGGPHITRIKITGTVEGNAAFHFLCTLSGCSAWVLNRRADRNAGFRRSAANINRSSSTKPVSPLRSLWAFPFRRSRSFIFANIKVAASVSFLKITTGDTSSPAQHALFRRPSACCADTSNCAPQQTPFGSGFGIRVP